MELWIWLGSLIVAVASVGVVYWYAGHGENNNKKTLSWLAETQVGALSGIQSLVTEAVKNIQAENGEVPQPFSIRDYSEKVLWKMTSQTHRLLAIWAAESGVRLNRYISSKLG